MLDILLLHSILLTPLSDRGDRLRETESAELLSNNLDKTGQSLPMYIVLQHVLKILPVPQGTEIPNNSPHSLFYCDVTFLPVFEYACGIADSIKYISFLLLVSAHPIPLRCLHYNLQVESNKEPSRDSPMSFLGDQNVNTWSYEGLVVDS